MKNKLKKKKQRYFPPLPAFPRKFWLIWPNFMSLFDFSTARPAVLSPVITAHSLHCNQKKKSDCMLWNNLIIFQLIESRNTLIKLGVDQNACLKTLEMFISWYKFCRLVWGLEHCFQLSRLGLSPNGEGRGGKISSSVSHVIPMSFYNVCSLSAIRYKSLVPWAIRLNAHFLT